MCYDSASVCTPPASALPMSLISKSDREGLRSTFAAELQGNVTLKLSAGGAGPGFELARELMTEIASLSSKASLEMVEDFAAAPTTVVEGRVRGSLHFVGVPLGYELPVFIEAVKLASTGRSSLGEKVLERLAALGSARHVRVFTAPD